MKKLEAKYEGKVLGLGEVMLRLTPPGYEKIIQANSFSATYAGGEANVICSLSMFGHDTKFVTKLPDNKLGEKVIKDLRSFGVDTKDIITGEGRLGIYFLEQGMGLRNTDVIYDRKYSAISMAKEDEFDIDKILEDATNSKTAEMNNYKKIAETYRYRIICVDMTDVPIEECKKRNIIVSYDSNFRAKLWSLEDARQFMLEILPYVDIAFLGILDFKNILLYDIPTESFEENLKILYKKLFEKYPNLKFASSTRRKVNSVNNNSLKGYLFDGENVNKSKEYTFDILDRVGGGDSFTAGILHGLLNQMTCEETVEFATCASVLKHSISGDMNLVSEKDIKSLMMSGVENINR